tara:strand:- start:2110 stop:2277 length:168 start_codon:yes stop_codon:yes gene_type:complete
MSHLKSLTTQELSNDINKLLFMNTTNANQLKLIDEMVAELKSRGFKRLVYSRRGS